MNLLNIMLNMDIHWPVGAKFAVQDDDGALKWSFHDELPKWGCGSGVWHRGKGSSDPEYGRIELADDYETCIILKEEYQEAGGWIEWSGGDCPVEKDQMIEYRMRSAGQDTTISGNLRWNHNLHGTGEETLGDIIAYRLCPSMEKQQTSEAGVAVEASENITDTVPEVVSQTLEDKLKVIQEVRETIANTKVELQTQEETLKSLIAEVNTQMQVYGFTLQEQNNTESVQAGQPVITRWWELQKGDVIIARGREWNWNNKDKELVVEQVEDQDYPENLRIKASGDCGKDFDFVRRPTKD